MPRQYDVESLVSDIEKFLRDNLNAMVAAVEAEQVAAGLPSAAPAPIPDAAYFQFDWTADSLNQSVGVAIFIAEQSSQGEGPHTRQTFVLDVGVYLSGTNNDPLADRKLLRYSKALKLLFEQAWGAISNNVTREKLETVGPIEFKFNVNSNDDCKIAGVTLSCTLG